MRKCLRRANDKIVNSSQYLSQAKGGALGLRHADSAVIYRIACFGNMLRAAFFHDIQSAELPAAIVGPSHHLLWFDFRGAQWRN